MLVLSFDCQSHHAHLIPIYPGGAIDIVATHEAPPYPLHLPLPPVPFPAASQSSSGLPVAHEPSSSSFAYACVNRRLSARASL